ncbi:MAG: heme o synthase, partial [Rhodobacterales bacterium]
MSDASIITPAPMGEASFGDYFALLKPRVMSLVVFTSMVGLFASPVAVHPMIGFA